MWSPLLPGGVALQDVFLTPLGLAAFGVAVTLVVPYLIRPDPDRVRLPTVRFLAERERQRSTTPLFERLSRSLLLVVQLVALALLAVSLATPHVPVDRADSTVSVAAPDTVSVGIETELAVSVTGVGDPGAVPVTVTVDGEEVRTGTLAPGETLTVRQNFNETRPHRVTARTDADFFDSFATVWLA